MIKRLFDVVVASMVLFVLLPVMAVVAIAVRLDSPGSVIFRQQRVGLRERHFELLKFRSMVVGARQLGSYSTSSNDTRITPVGRFIRRTSLDELPQLVNVIKGDMSLVGPRPDVPEQAENYSPSEWTRRHMVRPGITGLAQAVLRSEATPEQRKELDLNYVERSGLSLDLWVLILTLGQLFGRRAN